MITLELWQLITLLLAFFAFVGGVFKLFMHQQQKWLDEKFKSQEESRAQASRLWDQRFHAIEALEKDFLRFQAELPVLYVRREDYVRGQTVIEAKQDALYQKLEVVQLQIAQQRSPQNVR